MYLTMNAFITSLLYAALTGGALLVGYGSFRSLRLIIMTRRRLRARDGGEGRLREHASALLLIATGGRVTLTAFVLASSVMFLLTLAVAAYSLSPPRALAMALASGAAPYALLRIRAWSVNRRGSQEGERLTAALLNQYRIQRRNIYETLEKTVAAGDDFRVCKTLLFKLLLDIRNTADAGRIRRATDVFALAINTNWSRMLAHNIRLAAETGVDVASGFEDVLVQLREARGAMEERKRLNAESARIAVFLIPAMYLGSAYLAVRHMGTSLPTLIRNQFCTAEGFMLFFAIALLFVVNLALVEAVLSQKMDF